MGIGQIMLLLIAVALMGGVAWWALKGSPVPKAPPGQMGTPAQAAQYRQDVLAGRAPPPRDDDPRRDTSGHCIPPWHSVLQWDLSSRCDLPDGYTVAGGETGPWYGHAPGVVDIGVPGASGPTVPPRDQGGTGEGIGSVGVVSR